MMKEIDKIIRYIEIVYKQFGKIWSVGIVNKTEYVVYFHSLNDSVLIDNIPNKIGNISILSEVVGEVTASPAR